MSEIQAAQAAAEGIGLDNAIAIAALIAAAGAVVFSALTYNRNKKSEQIKIAREQMDKISKKYERLLEVKIESLVNEGIPSQLIFVYHIEEIMKECEYFGYLNKKNVIEDDDIISYYKPEITSIFVELMSFGGKVFQKMNEKRQVYPDLDKNIDGHIKLVDKYISSWG